MGAHFFSQTDVNTQKRYQRLFSDAIGIVIDPKKYAESNDLAMLDIFMWKIGVSGAIKLKFDFSRKFLASIQRLKSIKESIKKQEKLWKFISLFENFLKEQLDGRLSCNYLSCKYRINYLLTKNRIFAHFYYKKMHGFDINSLVLKGDLSGQVKAWKKKLRNQGFKATIQKNRGSRFNLIVFSSSDLEMNDDFKELVTELHYTWKKLYNLA